MQLSKVLFWDTDYHKIDWENKAQYVIAKVVSFGTIADWNQIKAYYGMDRIKKEMLQVRSLDPKSLNFLSVVFDIPKEEFRCYTGKPSSRQHWSS